LSSATISPCENLGRGVFSSRNAKSAKRGRVPFRVFLERLGNPQISVDRLDLAPLKQLTKNGDTVAAGRNTKFYGWAVVAVQQAESNGRRVNPSPLPNNPYHADIVLPASAVENLDELKIHAQNWRMRPTGSNARPPRKLTNDSLLPDRNPTAAGSPTLVPSSDSLGPVRSRQAVASPAPFHPPQ